jgi:ubiquinone/menaquinone biosynthesis C-methylase UbiE
MSNNERRFDPQKRHGLHSAERTAKWQPRTLLGSLSIQPGHTVLDLGCGTGFWTLPLADLAGALGTVWALDVSQEMLDALADRQPPPTVRLLRSELPHIDLPDAAVDWIWGAFVIHEVEPLAELMDEMRRVLRPGGQVAILDWRPDAASSNGPPAHLRLSPAMVTEHLQAAGFEVLPQTWQHEDGYLIEAHSDGRR